MKTTKFDIADFLDNKEMITEYLNTVLEEGDNSEKSLLSLSHYICRPLICQTFLVHSENDRKYIITVYLKKTNNMETITIDILNPKAKALLKDLADLELIRIRKDNKNSDFADLLKNFRKNADKAPSLEEITAEVEAVRKARYEK